MEPRRPGFVYITYIKSTPEKLWEALTTSEFTRRYWFDTSVESDWQVGSRVTYRRENDITDDGVVLQTDRPHLLSYTFHPMFDEELRSEQPSRVTFHIEPQGAAVRLTVVHDDFPMDSKVYPLICNGWPSILSSLKTLLETGSPLELA